MEFYIIDSSGNKVPFHGGGNLKKERIIAAATTLTMADSGSVLSLKAAAGAAITLPAVATSKGFTARVYVGLAFATTNWTLVATTNIIQGGAIVNSVYVPGVNENTVSFVATAETVGDYVDIDCDGVTYFINGVGALAGSITYTAP